MVKGPLNGSPAGQSVELSLMKAKRWGSRSSLAISDSQRGEALGYIPTREGPHRTSQQVRSCDRSGVCTVFSVTIHECHHFTVSQNSLSSGRSWSMWGVRSTPLEMGLPCLSTHSNSTDETAPNRLEWRSPYGNCTIPTEFTTF